MTNLPKSSDSHNQEWRSKSAFDSIVPYKLFLVRNEDGGDYGVDKIIEAKVSGVNTTNLRCYIQLKSTISVRNSDRSFTYSVPITTLNYLSNQPNSLFIVYFVNENIFLWEWVLNIVHSTRNKGIDINNTDQKTFDFLFKRELDDTSFNEIHQQIIMNGELIRQFNDIVSMTTSSTTSISVNLNTKNITSTEEIVTFVKKYGIQLINSTKFKEFEELIKQIPPIYKSDHNYCVAVAYYKFNNGEYFDALSWIPKTTSNISSDLIELYEYLNLTVRYLSGIIEHKAYKDGINNLLKKYPRSILFHQHKLYEQRDLLINSDPSIKDNYAKLYKSFTHTAQFIKKQSDKKSILHITVELTEWEVYGFQLLIELSFDYFLVNSREKIGHSLSLDDRVERAKSYASKISEWVRNFENLYNFIEDETIRAKVYTSFANLQLQFIANYQLMNNANKSQTDMLKMIKSSLLESVKILGEQCYIHELFRAKLSLAQCFYGMGMKNDAIMLVEEVLQSSESIGLLEISKSAKLILNGNFIFQLKENVNQALDEKVFLADLSESEINKYVRQTAEILNLPKERFPNLLIEYKWIQADEIEKINFCRHIHTLQDKRHSYFLETIYSVNPNRKFYCELLGYISSNSDTNRDSLLSRFKSDFCLNCIHKQKL